MFIKHEQKKEYDKLTDELEEITSKINYFNKNNKDIPSEISEQLEIIMEKHTELLNVIHKK